MKKIFNEWKKYVLILIAFLNINSIFVTTNKIYTMDNIDEICLRLEKRKTLLLQQIELSVIEEANFLSLMSFRELEAFRDRNLDEINYITRRLKQLRSWKKD
jgi:hypothetical protein